MRLSKTRIISSPLRKSYIFEHHVTTWSVAEAASWPSRDHLVYLIYTGGYRSRYPNQSNDASLGDRGCGRKMLCTLWRLIGHQHSQIFICKPIKMLACSLNHVYFTSDTNTDESCQRIIVDLVSALIHETYQQQPQHKQQVSTHFST